MTASRYQPERDVFIAEFPLGNASVALHDWGKPAWIHILVPEILVQIDIPEVTVVASNNAHHIFRLFLQEFDATLSTGCQVVTVREVKSITEILFELVYVLSDIMNDVHLYSC